MRGSMLLTYLHILRSAQKLIARSSAVSVRERFITARSKNTHSKLKSNFWSEKFVQKDFSSWDNWLYTHFFTITPISHKMIFHYNNFWGNIFEQCCSFRYQHNSLEFLRNVPNTTTHTLVVFYRMNCVTCVFRACTKRSYLPGGDLYYITIGPACQLWISLFYQFLGGWLLSYRLYWINPCSVMNNFREQGIREQGIREQGTIITEI